MFFEGVSVDFDDEACVVLSVFGVCVFSVDLGVVGGVFVVVFPRGLCCFSLFLLLSGVCFCASGCLGVPCCCFGVAGCLGVSFFGADVCGCGCNEIGDTVRPRKKPTKES